MITNILYCIDYPSQADAVEETGSVSGWLLCSREIISIEISSQNKNYIFNYRIPRPDVAEHFKKFPDNTECGFSIGINEGTINLKESLVLEVSVKDTHDKPVSLKFDFDLVLSQIKTIEIDDEQSKYDMLFEDAERLFQKTLQQHPWLTIRMDITNKCNLKCIMCHYKEREIYSRPTQAISAEQLQHKLKDIAPYVKHIMLSCGFEPLMSKHFHDILKMLHTEFPQIEIAFCTNGMLLDSKVRKSIIENDVSQIIFSLDGAVAETVERIRVGASFNKIISNILTLKELKQKYKRIMPLMYMDFVLMNSNIHETPAFVEMCSLLGIEMIDFRHLVGNIYFNKHEEMLCNNKPQYNYYRPLIVEAAKKHNIHVRLPEAYEIEEDYEALDVPDIKLTSFKNIKADEQTETVIAPVEIFRHCGNEADYEFLSGAKCMRPFNEIMISEKGKILPCSYYNDAMGCLDDNNTLFDIFFNDNFRQLRRRKLFGRFDHNCINCPIMNNLLPTDVVGGLDIG